jgi:hypothetical protein
MILTVVLGLTAMGYGAEGPGTDAISAELDKAAEEVVEDIPAPESSPKEDRPLLGWMNDLEIDLHGFYEVRAGYRTRKDPFEKDMSIMETRLQTDLTMTTGETEWKFKGDVFGDLVEEEAEFDLREANVFLRPGDNIDLKIGRQILTWGTGDLVFINDLFPKDWNSFFIGRDSEYLKAPSDAAKVSLFHDAANLDVVYTPQFDPDRYIDGRRISYWNGTLGRLAGNDAIVHSDRPDDWFRDDEIAMRLYKNIDNTEYALYGYQGFWKSPGGMKASGAAAFPDLNVYGASVRGTVGSGIGNLEAGYYDSTDDQSGNDPLVNNSELRFLAGYTQDVAKDLTAGVQYYIEHMMDYDAYRKNLPGGPARDEDRHLITLRLTQLAMDQNLRLSLFTYYSPSDKDVYLRPHILYKATDNLGLELGANIFFGDYANTFFGQFENNTNIYTAVRYTF